MRLRVSLIIAGGLALLLLLPVAAIVALGVYGSAQGGQSRAETATGAAITLLPAAGQPGTQVTVSGEGWQPREPIELLLIVEKPDQPPLNLTLGSVQASRAGEFDVAFVIPPLAFDGTDAQAAIQASGAAEEFEQASGLATAQFEVEPYPTRIALRVTDASGSAIAGARITVNDRFGRTATTVATDGEGTARIAGLAPGDRDLTVRALGYFPAGLSMTIPETTPESPDPIGVQLTASSGLRLVLPHPDSPGGGMLTYVEFDPIAGIAAPFTPTTTLSEGWITDVPSPGVRANFQLPTRVTRPNELDVVLEVANRVKGFGFTQPARLVYVGGNDEVGIVFATDDSYFRTQSLYVIDRDDVSLRRKVHFGPEELDPLISPDGSRVYVVDWFMREIDVIDAYTGRRLDRLAGLPRFTRAAALDSSGRNMFLVSALDDELRIYDLETGLVTRTFVKLNDVTTLWLEPNGRYLYGASFFSPVVARLDMQDLGIVELAPLPEPVEWIWAAPGSEFVLLGSRGGKAVQVLRAENMEFVASESFPEASSPEPASFGARFLDPA